MGGTGQTTLTTQVFSGRCLGQGRVWDCECANNALFSFLNCSVWQSFKRLPTTLERVRFRKNARRMRKLSKLDIFDTPSLEVFSVIQLCAIDGPLFPNLKAFNFWGIQSSFIPFIPLFLSPATTAIDFMFDGSDISKAMVASSVMTFPILCPNLWAIHFCSLPRDPIITTAVSGMLLVTNRDTLQKLDVDSPLTEEASEVIYKLPNLRSLSVVIGRGTSLPSASLPNLADLMIECDSEGDWPQLFHRAGLGKLESVTFSLRSEQIGDFLGAFKWAAFSSSIQNTLSKLHLNASCPWNPDYSSLLPFTQLVDLIIGSPCGRECSSTVDDDVIISLSRAMPKLKVLQLANPPCSQFTTGVTVKGLAALAHHCPDLSRLCIHFQVASLSVPPATPRVARSSESTASWTDCALTDLVVGRIPVPEQSVSIVAVTLARIFPRIERIKYLGPEGGWEKVKDAICLSKKIIDSSSK